MTKFLVILDWICALNRSSHNEISPWGFVLNLINRIWQLNFVHTMLAAGNVEKQNCFKLRPLRDGKKLACYTVRMHPRELPHLITNHFFIFIQSVHWRNLMVSKNAEFSKKAQLKKTSYFIEFREPSQRLKKHSDSWVVAISLVYWWAAPLAPRTFWWS